MHLVDFGDTGEPVLFAHANGYPPGSYRRMFQRFVPSHHVRAIEFRPLWQPYAEAPGLAGWGVFADDLIETLEAALAPPVLAFGHSMGAVATMLAATRRPDLFRGIALIDPVFLPGSFVLGVRLTPDRWRRKSPMIRKARNRPHHWDNRQAAYAFHRRARTFAGVPDEVLRDYIEAGTHQCNGGGVELSYAGVWEAAIYASVPYVWGALRRCRVPMLGIRGAHSTTLTRSCWQRWKRLQANAEFVEIDETGHLAPLQQPAQVADAVRRFFERC